MNIVEISLYKKKNMQKIVYNAIQCNNCKEIIESRFTHDFNFCSCGNVAVDGGLSYARRNYTNNLAYTELSLFNNSPFNLIREKFSRYNTESEKRVFLKDIPDDWLQNILNYYIPPNNIDIMDSDYLTLYLQEKLYRAEKEY